MSPAIDAVFAEWSLPPLLTISIVLTGSVYLRGWLAIRKTRRAQFSPFRLNCFLLGLATLWIAIASPLDGFADLLLSAHMMEHLILMSVVPPLLLLGWPVVPLLRGLPAPLLAPLLRLSIIRRLGRWLISPLVAWIALNAVFVGWHVPAAYDFALEHEDWHAWEHLCFLTSSLAFWWGIIRPWPTRAQGNSWAPVFSLLSADLVNTALSAFLAFCDRPVYNYYLTRTNPFHVAPLSDQILGAAVMWVAGSFVFLIPATVIAFKLLQSRKLEVATD